MPDYPNLRHLRLFLHALEAGSLSRAAAIVGVSQPAASQGLARLEAFLGGPLVERSEKGLVVTDRGRLVEMRGRRALAQLAAALGETASADATRVADHYERHVTIAQLQAISALLSAGSVATAALRLGKGKGAVQRALREIEGITGVVLLCREGTTQQLSQAGAGIARAAGLALGELASLSQDLAELDGRFDGKLVVASLPLVRSTILPQAIAAWIARRPKASIDLREGSYDVLIAGLLSGEIDMLIGALRDAPPGAGLAQEKLFDDALEVVARAGHPLANAPSLSFGDLNGFGWVLPRKGTPTRAIFESLSDPDVAGNPPCGLIETASLALTCGVLGRTDRLTLISPRQIAHEIGRGTLCVLPVDIAGTSRSIGLTTRKGWKPTVLQSEFVEALRRFAS